MSKIKNIIKNVKVKPTLMVDKYHICFELLPTFGFVKKPFGWCAEQAEPVGYTYGIAIGWLVFGLAIYLYQEMSYE